MNDVNEQFIELDESYLPQMAELYRISFKGEPWNDDWSDASQLNAYMKEISGNYNALNYGLVIEGQLVAMSIGMIRHWWEGTNYNIEELCVSPELRNKGMGSRFMKMIEDDIFKRGLCGIFLQTDSDKPSYRFYKKNEFFDLDKHVSLYKSVRGRRVIETDRLFLRQMDHGDFDALYKVLSDHEIMKYYPYSFDEAKVMEWIDRNMKRYENDGFGLWAVCLKTTGEMIGDCGLTLQNIDGTMLPEIGYHIRADQQRKGYAKEAAAAVRDWAFAQTSYPALYSYCKYTNEPSYKTAESIGMHFEKEYPDKDNEITHVSVIRREEYEQI